jgi:phosphatidylglycerophosphatase A
MKAPGDLLARLIGQWFGTGLSPVAPGTVGSLGALPLFFLLRHTPWAVYWSTTLLVTMLGVWAAERCAELLGDDDPGSVVIDEVAGVLIALGFVRYAPLWVLAAAWLCFRVLDITKPSLIDKAQELRPAGVGIMVDDVLAGLAAGALTSLAAPFFF